MLAQANLKNQLNLTLISIIIFSLENINYYLQKACPPFLIHTKSFPSASASQSNPNYLHGHMFSSSLALEASHSKVHEFMAHFIENFSNDIRPSSQLFALEASLFFLF